MTNALDAVRDALAQPSAGAEAVAAETYIRDWVPDHVKNYIANLTDPQPDARDAAVTELLEAAKDARFALYGTGAGNPRLDAAIAAIAGSKS